MKDLLSVMIVNMDENGSDESDSSSPDPREPRTRWQGDGNDYLESMTNDKVICITAGYMRRFMLQQQEKIRKEADADRRELAVLKKFVQMQEAGREDEWDIVHGCNDVWDMSESATVALRLAREAREKVEAE